MKKLLLTTCCTMLAVLALSPLAHAQFVFSSTTPEVLASEPVAPSATQAPVHAEDVPNDVPGESSNGIISGHGKTNAKGVNLRASASSKAGVVAQIAISGTIVTINGSETNAEGEKWLSVAYGKKAGYIRSDLVSPVTDEEYDQITTAATSSERLKSATAKPITKQQPTQTERPRLLDYEEEIVYLRDISEYPSNMNRFTLADRDVTGLFD